MATCVTGNLLMGIGFLLLFVLIHFHVPPAPSNIQLTRLSRLLSSEEHLEDKHAVLANKSAIPLVPDGIDQSHAVQAPKTASLPSRGPFPAPPKTVYWNVPAVGAAVRPDPASFREPIWQLITKTVNQQHMKYWKTNVYTLEDILTRQFPVVCSRTLESHIRSKEGLFSSLNQVAGAMAVAFRMNRTFVPRGAPILYAPTEQCKKEPWKGEYSWWNCIFMPITNCTPKSLKFLKGNKDYIDPRVANVYQHVDYFSNIIRRSYEVPPRKPAHVLHNANLMAYLFRPVPAFVEYAASVRDWLGLRNASYATIHIRQTDKVDTDDTFTVGGYMDLLLRNLPAGVAKVFVMTDNTAALDDLRRIVATNSSFRGLQFIWKPEARPPEGATMAFRFVEGSMNPIQHTAEFLADILIAINSTLFIGGCNSHIGRAMIALIAARAPGQKRTLMVDEPSCKFHAERWFNFNRGNKKLHSINWTILDRGKPGCVHTFCSPKELEARIAWDKAQTKRLSSPMPISASIPYRT